jgi:hypothetical protein
MGKAISKRISLLALSAAVLPLATMSLIGKAEARITEIVVTKRASAFDGATFGAVGAYEQLEGTAYGEIDPRDPVWPKY